MTEHRRQPPTPPGWIACWPAEFCPEPTPRAIYPGGVGGCLCFGNTRGSTCPDFEINLRLFCHPFYRLYCIVGSGEPIKKCFLFSRNNDRNLDQPCNMTFWDFIYFFAIKLISVAPLHRFSYKLNNDILLINLYKKWCNGATDIKNQAEKCKEFAKVRLHSGHDFLHMPYAVVGINYFKQIFKNIFYSAWDST